MRLGKFLEINGLRFLHTLPRANQRRLVAIKSFITLAFHHPFWSLCLSKFVFQMLLCSNLCYFLHSVFSVSFLISNVLDFKTLQTLQRETPHKNVGKAYLAMKIFHLNFSMYDTTVDFCPISINIIRGHRKVRLFT